MTKPKLTVCVVGGGNSAHVLIPFLSTTGHKVNLMTRRPNEWQDEVVCDIVTMENEITDTFRGQINKKSSDPSVVIPETDAIILCMPVHQYRHALDRIAPHLNKEKENVFVGTIYGQAGFNWMVHEVEREYHLNNIVCFAVGLIPWICRTTKYGHHVQNYGGKLINVVAVTPPQQFEKLNSLLLDDISWTPMKKGKFKQACSFLSLTLSVDNQMIHPSRCYGLWKEYGGKWSDLKSVPYFYRDFDDVSADILKGVDEDYSAVRAAVRKHFVDRPFTYMLSYLDLEKLSHNSKHENIKASFKDSLQLGAIKTPTLELEDGSRILDTTCRFFTDDIPYGLLLAKWVAEQLNVKTPFIDEIIIWAQNLRNEHWLNDDHSIDMNFCMTHKQLTGLPPSYGINNVDDILD